MAPLAVPTRCPDCGSLDVRVRFQLNVDGEPIDAMWGGCGECSWESEYAALIPLNPYPTLDGALFVRAEAVA